MSAPADAGIRGTSALGGGKSVVRGGLDLNGNVGVRLLEAAELGAEHDEDLCGGGGHDALVAASNSSRSSKTGSDASTLVSTMGATSALLVRVRGVFEFAVDAARDEGGFLADVDGVVTDALDRPRDLRHPHRPLAGVRVTGKRDRDLEHLTVEVVDLVVKLAK